MDIVERLLKHSKINEATGCREWQRSKDRRGYGKTRMDGKGIKAHRASYLAFNGPIQDGLFVLHECDNPSCINPEHLTLGDQKKNMADASLRNRVTRGTERKNAKLDESKIASMMMRFADGATSLELTAEFGVSMSTVHRVVRGEKWKHLRIDGVKFDRALARQKTIPITVELVRQMLCEHRDGATSTQLARKYGLHTGRVSAIVLRKTWKHVTIE